MPDRGEQEQEDPRAAHSFSRRGGAHRCVRARWWAARAVGAGRPQLPLASTSGQPPFRLPRRMAYVEHGLTELKRELQCLILSPNLAALPALISPEAE